MLFILLFFRRGVFNENQNYLYKGNGEVSSRKIKEDNFRGAFDVTAASF